MLPRLPKEEGKEKEKASSETHQLGLIDLQSDSGIMTSAKTLDILRRTCFPLTRHVLMLRVCPFVNFLLPICSRMRDLIHSCGSYAHRREGKKKKRRKFWREYRFRTGKYITTPKKKKKNTKVVGRKRTAKKFEKWKPILFFCIIRNRFYFNCFYL